MYLQLAKQPPNCFSKWSCMSVPIAPHPHQHLLVTAFSILALLVGVKWHLLVVVCISPMTNDMAHLFLGLSYMSAVVKCVFEPFPHLGTGLVCLIVLQEFLTYSRYKSFVSSMCYKYLLPVCVYTMPFNPPRSPRNYLHFVLERQKLKYREAK